jgi:hypothetical protein
MTAQMHTQDGPMGRTVSLLTGLGLPAADLGELPTSGKTFEDGRRWRIEIPSVEGPDALIAVLDEARKRDVTVHRVSQGSGIMLQTDSEIVRMAELGREHDVEVCLFTGPRAAWDIGRQASTPSGAVAQVTLRGQDQVRYAVEDVRRGCELGLRSVLVADLGLLHVLAQAKVRGDLPSDLVLKTSVSLPCTNAATARVLEDLGASTLNLSVDLPLASVAAIRAAVDLPVDVYIEGADDFGSPIRYFEVPELVRVAAPIYLKFTVRNAPGLYPAGGHLEGAVLATARERVRRASIGLSMLRRYASEL